jgi:hypothetical protein
VDKEVTPVPITPRSASTAPGLVLGHYLSPAIVPGAAAPASGGLGGTLFGFPKMYDRLLSTLVATGTNCYGSRPAHCAYSLAARPGSGTTGVGPSTVLFDPRGPFVHGLILATSSGDDGVTENDRSTSELNPFRVVEEPARNPIAPAVPDPLVGTLDAAELEERLAQVAVRPNCLGLAAPGQLGRNRPPLALGH